VKSTALLRRRILSRNAQIAVVGQGYVGLTLACSAADAGFNVIGLDIDPRRISELSRGVLSVPGVSRETFDKGFSTGRLSFTVEAEQISQADVICICVPTPSKEGTPDLSYVEAASASVATKIRPGVLVVLESTTYPGTTGGPVRRALETSGLIAGRDFLLAYSPERIDPGNVEFDLRSVPRIVGGMTPEATGVAGLFYAQLVDKVFEVSSCKAAELAKLLENTFRHVNIALANEMAMICHETDENVWEVIEAAASKPFGFMPFYPGPGVGGHCIPVDPTFLAWQVRRDAGHQFRVLEQAHDVNVRMPAWVASRVSDALNEAGKAVKSAGVLVLGVSYKPDVGDIRESPSIEVLRLLQKRGARVTFHDPYVKSIPLNGSSLARSELTSRAVSSADCVALLTPHRAYDLDWIADLAQVVFDARNAYRDQKRKNVVRL
jgi:UDP-N-acetyl-D-glucosamine dehydrogenase